MPRRGYPLGASTNIMVSKKEEHHNQAIFIIKGHVILSFMKPLFIPDPQKDVVAYIPHYKIRSSFFVRQ